MVAGAASELGDAPASAGGDLFAVGSSDPGMRRRRKGRRVYPSSTACERRRGREEKGILLRRFVSGTGVKAGDEGLARKSRCLIVGELMTHARGASGGLGVRRKG